MSKLVSVSQSRGCALFFDRLNQWMKRYFVLTLLAAVVLGALCPWVGRALKDCVFFRIPATRWNYDFLNLALGLMMLSASVQCQPKDFKQIYRRPKAGLASLVVVYLLVPAFVVGLGSLWAKLSASANGQQVFIGLLLTALMPVAMTSAIWVRMNGGNLPLLFALITFTTGFGILAVPACFSAFVWISGTPVQVSTDSMVQQLAVSVTVPLVVGMAIRQRAPKWVAKFQSLFSLLGNWALLATVVANVAIAAPHVSVDPKTVAGMVVMTLVLNLSSYAIGYLFARSLKLSRDEALTVLFGAGMRSNGTALVLGTKSFPGLPLVTVPAAVFIMSQHLIAAYLSRCIESGKLIGPKSSEDPRALPHFLNLAMALDAQQGGVGLVVVKVEAAELPVKSWYRLLGRVRRSIRLTDFVCALSADSFALVLVGARDVGCTLVAERIRNAASELLPDVTVSCGTVHSHNVLKSPQELIAVAYGNAATPSRWTAQLPN